MDVTASARIKPALGVPNGKIFVNGVEIPRTMVAQEMQNHPAAKPGESWGSAARALAIRELLLQRGRLLGLTPKPLTDSEDRRETIDEALVRAVIEHDVVTPNPDTAACQRYYEQNKQRFRSPDLFEVDHILIAAAPADAQGRTAARAQADILIAKLEAAPTAFAALALDHSACPSRDVGGNLGQIGPGQTVPEFEKALYAIPVGDIGCEAVETRYGVHVVRVNRRRDGQQLPFELVTEQIADYLRERVHHAAIRQYISILAGNADIKGVDLNGTVSPLVQ